MAFEFKKPSFVAGAFRPAAFKAPVAPGATEETVEPIDVEMHGHVEHVWKKLDAIRDRINQQNDHNFYVTLMFRSVGEKWSFLENSGLFVLGDKFLPGPDAAGILGVEIAEGPPMREPRPREQWSRLALEIGEYHGTSEDEQGWQEG